MILLTNRSMFHFTCDTDFVRRPYIKLSSDHHAGLALCVLVYAPSARATCMTVPQTRMCGCLMSRTICLGAHYTWTGELREHPS